MSGGNRKAKNPELMAKLQQIQSLAAECLELAGDSGDVSPAKQKGAGKFRDSATTSLDFDMPVRPFMKRYANVVGGGPKKFVLLLARLTKGDLKREMLLGEVKKQWNTMTSLLGGRFNRFYSGQAKDNDWVEVRRKGVYALRPGWKEILRRS